MNNNIKLPLINKNKYFFNIKNNRLLSKENLKNKNKSKSARINKDDFLVNSLLTVSGIYFYSFRWIY